MTAYNTKPIMHGKPWSKHDTEYIKTKWEKGYSIGFIANLVERIPSAVFMKLYNTGVIDYKEYGFTFKSDIYRGSEEKIAKIVIKSSIFFGERELKDTERVLVAVTNQEQEYVTYNCTLNYKQKGETEMSNQRKKVVVRMWCDSPYIKSDELSLVYESGDFIATEFELRNIRDDILIQEGNYILEQLDVLNAEIKQNNPDDNNIADITIQDLRLQVKEV